MVILHQIAVCKLRYMGSYARLSNVRSISEYSVSLDREVLNDRTHARYLVSENINKNVDVDLKKGIDTFIQWDLDTIKKESGCNPLCNWACAQEGDDLKKLFSGAHFAGSRGMMKRIAKTLTSHPRTDPWIVIAVKVGGVILLCEKSKEPEMYSEEGLSYYCGFKFEQYMTNDSPNGEAVTDVPVDNRPQFKRMVRSDLVLNGTEIGICCGAEIDALRRDSACELKTRQFKGKHSFGYHAAHGVILQMELAGVSTLVVGWKNDNYVVETVEELDITALKSEAKKGDEQCLTFLFDVLLLARKILGSRDACEMRYNPAKGVVEFNDFPKEEAMNLLTPEFKKKFNLGD